MPDFVGVVTAMGTHAPDPQIEPFPWGWFERHTAARSRELARARRHLASLLPVAAFAAECGRLLRRPARFHPIDFRIDDYLAPFPGYVHVLLSRDGGPPGLAMYVPNDLAVRLASHVSKQPLVWVDDEVEHPDRKKIQGAATAFVLTAVRRLGAPWRLAKGALSPGTFAFLRGLFSVGEGFEDGFDFVIACPVPRMAPPSTFDTRTLAALGDTPISLPVVVSSASASDADLAALTPGAAWNPGETWTARRAPDGSWQGTALLVPPWSDVGLEVQTDPSGRWRLNAGSRLCSDEASQPDGASEDDVAAQALRVEAGSVTLAARDWAALTPGSVVPLCMHRKVTLRAGGRAVARGVLGQMASGEDVVLVQEMSMSESAPVDRAVKLPDLPTEPLLDVPVGEEGGDLGAFQRFDKTV